MPTPYFKLSDQLWEKIRPYIPPRVNTHPRGGGRKPTDDRIVMNAVLFVLQTGCQWKALDLTGICPGSTAHGRFQQWVQQGLFQRLWEEGLLLYDETKGVDWTWLSMDGAMTKAPLGGEKNRAQSHRSRQIRNQAKPADRCQRHSCGANGGGGQRTRHHPGCGYDGKHSRLAADSDRGGAAAFVLGQRL